MNCVLTYKYNQTQKPTSYHTHKTFLQRRQRTFTGKGFYAKTDRYYYEARYLDPRTSRWLGVDPAMGEYVPSAPINEEAKKRNGNLPGMGGVFNYVNFHVYHYAGNNPVKLVDPDGRIIQVESDGVIYSWDNEKNEFFTGSGDDIKYGTNNDFANKVKDSLIYLKESEHGSQMINSLSTDKRKISIINSYTNNFVYNSINFHITFNPELGLSLNDDGTDSYSSSSMSLFHELSHSHSYLIQRNPFPTKYFSTKKRNEKLLSLEENRAVASTDIVARQLGEPLRINYSNGEYKSVNSVRDFRNNQRR